MCGNAGLVRFPRSHVNLLRDVRPECLRLPEGQQLQPLPCGARATDGLRSLLLSQLSSPQPDHPH